MYCWFCEEEGEDEVMAYGVCTVCHRGICKKHQHDDSENKKYVLTCPEHPPKDIRKERRF